MKNVGFYLLIAVMVVMIGFFIDAIWNHNKLNSYVFYGSGDCSYDYPSQYKILSNGNDYIVKVKSTLGDEYLWAGKYGISEHFDVNVAIHFVDTCNAISAMKAHYIEKHPKSASENGYK